MDVREKSFQAAAEASKLLFTLGTGSLGAGLALLNFEIGKNPPSLSPVSWAQRFVVASALIALLISVALGVCTQLAITHVLSMDTAKAPADVWNLKIRWPFCVQIITFLFGAIALVGYGIVRVLA